MLGAAQLAWFQAQLLQPEPLKVVVEDTAWMGTFLSGEGDKWWAYSTERSAIISYITANRAAIGGLLWIHGDSHCLGAASAADNATWGGFPVYCASPLRQTGAAVPNAAATFPRMYNNGGGDCRQYARISFADTGTDQISVTFSAWDALYGVERFSQADIFQVPADIAGPAASASSAAGSLAGVLALTGGAGAPSMATGSVTAGFGGAASSGTSAAGAVTEVLALAGTAPGTAGGSGTLTLGALLAGQAAAMSDAAGLVILGMILAGSASSGSAASGSAGAPPVFTVATTVGEPRSAWSAGEPGAG
jgi:hypothetical protein